jgi:indolepyruvate ferredoxin oxidoreductase alpha subunit
VNAVYNNSRIVVAILDNQSTAMTGHQPHPGTGITGLHGTSEKILVEKVAEGCGVKYVKVVNPFETKTVTETLKEALKQSGPSVIVFRSPCTLMDLREKGRLGIKVVPARITDKCTDCMACVKLLACPAIIVEDKKPEIDQNACTGCGLCVSVCPYKAIEGSCAE